MPVKRVTHYVATLVNKRPISCGWLPGANLFLGIPLRFWNAGVHDMAAVAWLQHPAKKAV